MIKIHNSLRHTVSNFTKNSLLQFVPASCFFNFGKKPVASPTPSEDLELLRNNVMGINLLINRVYITTGMAFLTSFTTSFVASSIPYFMMNPIFCIGAGSLASITGLYGAYYLKPVETSEEIDGTKIFKTRNNLLRLSLYFVGCSGLGIASLPLLAMTASLSPQIISNLIVLTIGSFGGASIVSHGLSKYAFFHYGGLIGSAIGGYGMMRLLHHASNFMYGENFTSVFIQKTDTYLGSLLFFYFIFYNTRLAISSYKSGKTDHIGITLQFIFDFINFVKRIMKIIFNRQ